MSNNSRSPRVLIADDQQDVLRALRLLLKGEGFELETATTPAGVLSSLESSDFDAVLMDLNYARDTTSGREGLDLLPRIRALDATLPVVVMTAWGSIESAVEAVRKGAGDYVEKPWDNSRLLTILNTQIELGRALRRAQPMFSSRVSPGAARRSWPAGCTPARSAHESLWSPSTRAASRRPCSRARCSAM